MLSDRHPEFSSVLLCWCVDASHPIVLTGSRVHWHRWWCTSSRTQADKERMSFYMLHPSHPSIRHLVIRPSLAWSATNDPSHHSMLHIDHLRAPNQKLFSPSAPLITNLSLRRDSTSHPDLPPTPINFSNVTFQVFAPPPTDQSGLTKSSKHRTSSIITHLVTDRIISTLTSCMPQMNAKVHRPLQHPMVSLPSSEPRGGESRRKSPKCLAGS